MKATLSLTLVLALMTSALPVTAQERMDGTVVPIGRAIALQAVRLAAEPVTVDAGQQAGTSANANSWAKRHPAATGALVGLGAGAIFNLTPLIGLRTNFGAFSPLYPCHDGSDDRGLCLVMGLSSAGLGAGIGAAIGTVIGAYRNKTQDVICREPKRVGG